MRWALSIAAALVMTTPGVAWAKDNSLTAAERAQGWKLLFNGRDLSGWQAFGGGAAPSTWTVRDGTLLLTKADGKMSGTDLVTAEPYGAFELTLDWKVEGRGRTPSWIGLFAFYALIPFSIYGFVRLVRRRITILPLLASPIILTLATALTFGVTRYRAPAEVSIVVTAAIGVVALVHRVRHPERPAPATVTPAPEPADAATTIARS